MKLRLLVSSFFLIFAMMLLAAGCDGGSDSSTTAPLSSDNINLIFVISPDLAYQTAGDMNPDTANLSNQGLQRSLLMATYLKEQVLGGSNVTAIYTLSPMTHLQTANDFPDMAAIEYIQQFALLNQFDFPSEGPGTPLYTGNSYPLNVSYGSGPLPAGVETPSVPSLGCQGLDFNDADGNQALVMDIIDAGVPGFYVFSAPWEAIGVLLADIDFTQGYGLNVPDTYRGSNYIYAISITQPGAAFLVTYDSDLDPPAAYPQLPAPVPPSACPAQHLFTITRTGGSDGNIVPADINTNETVYIVRHADAHPTSEWDDGNYVGAGQWRALALPSALQGIISPTAVYSIDPAQAIAMSEDFPGMNNMSYVRPSLTVAPYAIANDLPYYLVAEFEMNDPDSPQLTAEHFFTGGTFSNQIILLAWESGHIGPTVNALLDSYQGSGQTAPGWSHDDYDSIWTVTLDGLGNVTVTNALCEGIDSANLPAEAPQF